MTPCRIPEISLLYASWSSEFPGVVHFAVILSLDDLSTSTRSADIPKFYLKYPSLTITAVPLWIDLEMYLYIALVAR